MHFVILQRLHTRLVCFSEHLQHHMLARRSDCKLILSSPAWVFEVKFVCSNLGCSSSKLCDVLAISFEEDSCSDNHRSALKKNPSCGIIHPQVQHPSSFRRLVRQQPLLPELAGPVGREGAMRASANRVCGNADLRNEKTRSAIIRQFCVTACSYDQPPRIALHQLFRVHLERRDFLCASELQKQVVREFNLEGCDDRACLSKFAAMMSRSPSGCRVSL